MKQNKTYLHLGVTLIVSACAVLMFYDTFFQSRVLLDFFDKLMSVLSPVIYGLVFAYLLAPIVDFFDRYIQKGLPKVKSSLVRGLSILVTWICVIALIYLMFKFPYTPIISVFVGVTNIIPIFGPFLGAIPSAFLILLVSPKQCLYFILFIIALQQFDGNILGPKILGKSTGISSFWVIVAIVVGGGFGGVLGMFLGVPIFACISSLVNWFTNRSLTKKGVTDDAMFAPAPLASPDEKKD